MAKGAAWIQMVREPEVRRIVLPDGPAVRGDPSQGPGQSRCLQATVSPLQGLAAEGQLKPVDSKASARRLNGMALNAALWVALAPGSRRSAGFGDLCL